MPQVTGEKGFEDNSDPVCKFVQEDCISDGTVWCITDTWAPKNIELNRLSSVESNSIVHMINREKLHIEISDGYQKAWNWKLMNLKDLVYSDTIELQNITRNIT